MRDAAGVVLLSGLEAPRRQPEVGADSARALEAGLWLLRTPAELEATSSQRREDRWLDHLSRGSIGRPVRRPPTPIVGSRRRICRIGLIPPGAPGPRGVSAFVPGGRGRGLACVARPQCGAGLKANSGYGSGWRGDLRARPRCKVPKSRAVGGGVPQQWVRAAASRPQI